MHYSTLIITAEKPTEADIERILEPFDESLYYDKWREFEEEYGEQEAYRRVESLIFTLLILSMMIK